MAVDPAEQPPRLAASIEPAVAALLNHIAEDLAREYVHLMERAAQEGGNEHPPWKGAQEA